MAFNKAHINGTGLKQLVFQNDLNHESVVHGIFVKNNSLGVSEVILLVDDLEILSIKVQPNSTGSFSDKLNIPPGSKVEIISDFASITTFSYFSQAIDVSAALSEVQQAVNEAYSYSQAAQNALPVGSLDDLNINTTTTWSSAKISNYLSETFREESPLLVGPATADSSSMTTINIPNYNSLLDYDMEVTDGNAVRYGDTIAYNTPYFPIESDGYQVSIKLRAKSKGSLWSEWTTHTIVLNYIDSISDNTITITDFHELGELRGFI